jgi:hypothetical protein
MPLYTSNKHTPRRAVINEPIAIVGLAFQFPGGCDTPEAFWKALAERRCTASSAPSDRYSSDSFWHPDTSRRGTLALRGGHYLAHDIAKFDAPFFNISETEAAALDPQQRGLLETAYRALENGKSLRTCFARYYSSTYIHQSGTDHRPSDRVKHLCLQRFLLSRLGAAELQRC